MLVAQTLMTLSLLFISDSPWELGFSQESQPNTFIDLPSLKRALRTENDLREKWKLFLLEELLEQRMEHIRTNQMTKEQTRDFLDIQINMIRAQGFDKEELTTTKARWIDRLLALEESSPEITSSLASLHSIELEELLPAIPLLLEKQPSNARILNADEPVMPHFCHFSEPMEHAAPREKTHSPNTIDAFYELPLSEHEKKLINELIRNMSERSIWGLLFKKREMERLGKRVNHVHPLRFISFILADPKLKHYLKDVSSSSFKWDHFIDGLSKRLKEEASRDNLTRYIPGMAHQLKFDPSRLNAFIRDKDYEGMVKAILNQR